LEGEAMQRTATVIAYSACLLLATATQGRSEDLVRIGLAVPNNAIYAPFYAADALGLFKQAELKVELTVYRGGAASQEALSAGAADMITYFGGGVGLAIMKGAKEKVVAALDPSRPSAVGSRLPSLASTKACRIGAVLAGFLC